MYRFYILKSVSLKFSEYFDVKQIITERGYKVLQFDFLLDTTYYKFLKDATEKFKP